MLSERDQLKHSADCLTDKQCEKVNQIIEVLFAVPPAAESEPFETCLFCQSTCRRDDLVDLGWVPSFNYPPGQGRVDPPEVFLPVCGKCAKTRLSYDQTTDSYNLIQ